MTRVKREWIISSFSYPLEMREVLKELDVIAVREDKTRSQLVCQIIEEYVKAHSEGNNTFKLDVWQEDPEFKAIPTLLSPQEKWSRYIDECSDEELTNIGIMSNRVHTLVSMRRTKEHKERSNKR